MEITIRRCFCLCAAIASLLGSSCKAVAQAVAEIPRQEALSHRISGVTWIRSPKGGDFQGLSLRITVDTNGTVTSVNVTEGPTEFHEASIALAKTWQYTPFQRNGQATPGILVGFISILPPERPTCRNVPFPSAREWLNMRITLKRTRCYGACPAYEVQIDGNGEVLFTGHYPVEGERRGLISQRELEELMEVFRKSNYFSLCQEYRIMVTDWPAQVTSISIDGQSMSVVAYGGLQAGMPVSVRDVEEAIDRVAGTDKWLHPSR